ncbi:MAG: ATP-dependent DNA helicase RecG [Vicinamibacterales bacterium]|nr:ATP-dependent DNA helicase RecG [Vicinamibacterales bacterium]
MNVTLETPLLSLKGVGPKRGADLAQAGLRSVGDLLARFPLRYEDRARFREMAGVRPGETVTVAGTVVSCGMRLTRRAGFKLFEAVVRDPSGAIKAIWLNQPFMANVVARGTDIILYGPADRRDTGPLQITNPQYELPGRRERDAIHTGRIVPIYEKAGCATCRVQRALVYDVVQQLPGDAADVLPAWLRAEMSLPDWRTAVAEAHFPPAGAPLDLLNAFRTPAQVRVILEEFLLFQVGLGLRRRSAAAERKPLVPVIDDRVRAAARAALPFSLTGAQRLALKDVVGDMARPAPMQRLLQGDVGAGKTIVALLAAVVAMENGLQVAFMAPTEILAEQHHQTIRRLLAARPYEVALLTGSTGGADRRRVLDALASGRVQLVVGTHALVQEAVAFARLGLVVVDEQHRFGVMQRAVLTRKGWNPDVLVMTATPIPRTLALTLYGDLDVSVIRELPPGRTPIETRAIPQSRRDEAHALVRRELDAGRQAYIVYPLVEESSKVDVRAATEMADHLASEVFPEYRLALLHGRLRPEEKDRVMRAFAAGEVQVLVSTTVIEVGIDVPNATVMVIEHAERFGLAQLHQLRGRVGRGVQPSACVLLYQEPAGETGAARLRALVETTDGFVLAERDLELRGPGDVFGTRQSGMPTLRSGDLVRDRGIMEQARRLADLALDREPEGALVAEARRSWSGRFGLASVG